VLGHSKSIRKSWHGLGVGSAKISGYLWNGQVYCPEARKEACNIILSALWADINLTCLPSLGRTGNTMVYEYNQRKMLTLPFIVFGILAEVLRNGHFIARTSLFASSTMIP